MTQLLIAVVPSIVSLLGIIITAAITNSLVKYRVGELEKKVEKHNSVIERVYKVETEVKDLKERL
ncbi:MAG: hypothetical protein IKE92_14740 [Clostridiales bacterium]|nr:hypothetical protein [Clostridiales bacterium]